MRSTASKKQALKNSLALNWLRIKRPDVMRAIEDEVEKKYPDKRKVATLPEALEELS